MSDHWDPQLFAGLKALAEGSFPKTCRNCGQVYLNEPEFIALTVPIPGGKTGLKMSIDEGLPIVEFFRNCRCGSTLMDVFSDRRDGNSSGQLRRQKMGELTDYLVAHGLDVATARSELIKAMHGERSEILRRFRPPATH